MAKKSILKTSVQDSGSASAVTRQTQNTSTTANTKASAATAVNNTANTTTSATTTAQTGKAADGSIYTVGSEKGLNFLNTAKAGETLSGGDGSTWTKNADGSTTITKNGVTYRVGDAAATTTPAYSDVQNQVAQTAQTATQPNGTTYNPTSNIYVQAYDKAKQEIAAPATAQSTIPSYTETAKSVGAQANAANQQNGSTSSGATSYYESLIDQAAKTQTAVQTDKSTAPSTVPSYAETEKQVSQTAQSVTQPNGTVYDAKNSIYVDPNLKTDDTWVGEDGNSYVGDNKDSTREARVFTSADGKQTYTVGSKTGLDWMDRATAGETLETGDGAIFAKNADGTFTVRKNGITYTYGTTSAAPGSGSSSYVQAYDKAKQENSATIEPTAVEMENKETSADRTIVGVGPNTQETPVWADEGGNRFVGSQPDTTREPVTFTATDGKTYVVGSTDGLNWIEDAQPGESKVMADGSTWYKNADGSYTIIDANGTVYSYGNSKTAETTPYEEAYEAASGEKTESDTTDTGTGKTAYEQILDGEEPTGNTTVETTEPSKYEQLILDALEQLNSRQFNYELESDPVWQSYKKQYTRLGNRAMQDALGAAAANTGGRASSYANTAMGQAYGNYMAQLTDQIPALYESAYNRYLNELSNDVTRINVYRNLLSDEASAESAAYERQSAAKQQEIENAMAIAESMGYVPEGFADILGVPAGTKTASKAYNDAKIALEQAQLEEEARQADNELSYKYSTLSEDARQADNTLAQKEAERQDEYAYKMFQYALDATESMGYVPDWAAEYLGVPAGTQTNSSYWKGVEAQLKQESLNYDYYKLRWESNENAMDRANQQSITAQNNSTDLQKSLISAAAKETETQTGLSGSADFYTDLYNACMEVGQADYATALAVLAQSGNYKDDTTRQTLAAYFANYFVPNLQSQNLSELESIVSGVSTREGRMQAINELYSAGQIDYDTYTTWVKKYSYTGTNP